jgi:hypothetical protein
MVLRVLCGSGRRVQDEHGKHEGKRRGSDEAFGHVFLQERGATT